MRPWTGGVVRRATQEKYCQYLVLPGALRFEIVLAAISGSGYHQRRGEKTVEISSMFLYVVSGFCALYFVLRVLGWAGFGNLKCRYCWKVFPGSDRAAHEALCRLGKLHLPDHRHA